MLLSKKYKKIFFLLFPRLFFSAEVEHKDLCSHTHTHYLLPLPFSSEPLFSEFIDEVFVVFVGGVLFYLIEYCFSKTFSPGCSTSFYILYLLISLLYSLVLFLASLHSVFSLSALVHLLGAFSFNFDAFAFFFLNF